MQLNHDSDLVEPCGTVFASFVAITRIVQGVTQLLVEVDSPVHYNRYHAIGGKGEPGELDHVIINRELAEECEITHACDVAVRKKWKTLDESNLLRRMPRTLYLGRVFAQHSHYLYPEEVQHVSSKGIKVGWVPLDDLSPLNSTSALDELVELLRAEKEVNLQ